MLKENIAHGTAYIERDEYIIDIASISATIVEDTEVISRDPDTQTALKWIHKYVPQISCVWLRNKDSMIDHTVVAKLAPVHTITYETNSDTGLTTSTFTKGSTEDINATTILEALETAIKNSLDTDKAQMNWTQAKTSLNSTLQQSIKDIVKLDK
jgi:hypothetical protein